MIGSLINPADTPERQHEKLLQIVEVLMRRVEQATDDSGAAYSQFQRAAMLEDQVRERTRELQHAMALLDDTNSRLADANRETEAARQNLANAIETVQEGFALFGADEVLIMCNSRFGQNLGDVHPRLQPGLHFSDYVDLVSRSRYLALPPGETPAQWARDRLKRHAESHVIFNVNLHGDIWLQVSEHRTRDGGTVILQTDVTDIIRLERQERGKLLDDQARIIRATLDHISQGVCIFDAEHQLAGWNQRLGELLTIPMNRLRVGSSIGTVLAGLGNRFRFGGGYSLQALTDWINAPSPRYTLHFEISRGNALVLAASAQEIPNRGFVMSFTDITGEREALRAISEANETLEQRVADRTLELAEALARAERANASRTRFVAAASHDLLQPLSAAKLFLASVSDESLGASARATLEKAQNALTGVEGILDALLDISRLESGLAAVEVVPVRLGQVLARIKIEFTPAAAGKGLRLDIVPSTAIVESDATYLRRILQNLISNAIRYTASGRVLVGARRRPEGLRVEVIDTGPGIPEAEQSSIFREFHRLNAHASAAEGMGLGLAIVDRACALLDHPLALQSVPGRGTRFSVTLPYARQNPKPLPVDRHPLSPEVHAPDGRIVCLVENDPAFRRAMCLLLEKWQLNVIEAETGEAALELIDEIGILPDIFLVDYQLGDGMNGLELIETMRRAHGRLNASIVTANRAPEIRRTCEDAGIDILQKPVTSEALAALLFSNSVSGQT